MSRNPERDDPFRHRANKYRATLEAFDLWFPRSDRWTWTHAGVWCLFGATAAYAFLVALPATWRAQTLDPEFTIVSTLSLAMMALACSVFRRNVEPRYEARLLARLRESHSIHAADVADAKAKLIAAHFGVERAGFWKLAEEIKKARDHLKELGSSTSGGFFGGWLTFYDPQSKPRVVALTLFALGGVIVPFSAKSGANLGDVFEQVLTVSFVKFWLLGVMLSAVSLAFARILYVQVEHVVRRIDAALAGESSINYLLRDLRKLGGPEPIVELPSTSQGQALMDKAAQAQPREIVVRPPLINGAENASPGQADLAPARKPELGEDPDLRISG